VRKFIFFTSFKGPVLSSCNNYVTGVDTKYILVIRRLVLDITPLKGYILGEQYGTPWTYSNTVLHRKRIVVLTNPVVGISN
jgi:hypothetical protein